MRSDDQYCDEVDMLHDKHHLPLLILHLTGVARRAVDDFVGEAIEALRSDLVYGFADSTAISFILKHCAGGLVYPPPDTGPGGRHGTD